MSFYVGQRVRIKSATQFPAANGREATIVGVAFVADWRLSIDGFGSQCGDGRFFAAFSDQLEPILRTPDAAEILALENLPEGPVREAVYARSAA